MLVDNDTFLKRLNELFGSSREKGSIWLTHKRLTHDGEDVTMQSADQDTKEYPCLIRVTDGKKIKISTQVKPDQLGDFHAAYGALLKSSMTSLRKRDKKREKLRAEEMARRKKRITEHIIIKGAKRGAGRRKRQRLIKASTRLEEAKKKAVQKEETKARAKAT